MNTVNQITLNKLLNSNYLKTRENNNDPKLKIGSMLYHILEDKKFLQRFDENKDNFIEPKEIVSIIKKQFQHLPENTAETLAKGFMKHYLQIFFQQHPGSIKNYKHYDEIVNTVKQLNQEYPNFTEIINLGKTTEGRDMIGLKITNPNSKNTKKKIFIQGTMHAREWAPAETVLNIMSTLLKNKDQEEISNILNNCEIYLLPVANPDGYEYSLNTNFMWRKNMYKKDGKLIGVDLNRNFHIEEKPELYRLPEDKPDRTDDDIGASDNEYSDAYRGPAGNSEIETRNLLNFIKNKKIDAILDFHGFGNMILYPKNDKDKVKTYEIVADKMNQSIGNKYWIEKDTELYPTTGTMISIADALGTLSYTIEIGSNFFPTKNELEILKGETYELTKTFLKEIMKIDKKIISHYKNTDTNS